MDDKVHSFSGLKKTASPNPPVAPRLCLCFEIVVMLYDDIMKEDEGTFHDDTVYRLSSRWGGL